MLEVIESNINSLKPNVQALQLDQHDLQSTLGTLCGKTSELSAISSSQSAQDVFLQSQINDIIGKACSQLRAIKLHVQKCQTTNMTPSSVNEDPPTVEVPSYPSTSVENPASPDIQNNTIPTSSLDTSVANNHNTSAVGFDPPTIIVSAPEFIPATTLPETSASNPYPVSSEQPAHTVAA